MAIVKISQLRQLMYNLPTDAAPKDPGWRMNYFRRAGINPGEVYQELEMESCFVDTHRDVTEAGEQISQHSHNFFELLYCRSDCTLEYLIGTRRYLMQKGDMVFVPPGVSHQPLLNRHMQQPYIRDVVWVSQEFMRNMCMWFPELLDHVGRESNLLRVEESAQEELGNLFEQGVLEAEKRNAGWELAVLGNTITLMIRLRRACEAQKAQPLKAETPQMLDRVLHHIEMNLAEKITLSDVASRFFVSESTITQLFRKKMGVSFYHCVTQRRLIAAKSLIGQNVPLEQVSEQVGFTDYSAFYRAFKKEYGISPAQYRKLLAQNGF